MNTDDMRYTYEFDENFTCYPTNAVTIAHGGKIRAGEFDDFPGMPEFNPMKILHGEETIMIEKPILPNTKYVI